MTAQSRLASAKLFAREGATVYITGRRQAELDAAVAQIGHATGAQVDSSKFTVQLALPLLAPQASVFVDGCQAQMTPGRVDFAGRRTVSPGWLTWRARRRCRQSGTITRRPRARPVRQAMSDKTMTQAQVADYCLGLPGAREDYKWGGVRVFSVAENKMFAVLDLAGAGLSFKVPDALFLGYCDRPGIRPAPYLARARWVSVAAPYALGRQELCALLEGSHQLVVRRLPKRLQVGLLLD